MFLQTTGRSQAAASTHGSHIKARQLLLAGAAVGILIAGLPAPAAAAPAKDAVAKELASYGVIVDGPRFEFRYAFQLRDGQDVTVVRVGYGSADVILCNNETGKGKYTAWKGSTREGPDILGKHCVVLYGVDGFDLNTQGEVPNWRGVIFVRPAAH